MLENEVSRYEVETTSDGTHTIRHTILQCTYHSINGALKEAQHIYIEHGLRYWLARNEGDCSILEMGFGTGLNALLCCLESTLASRKINYTGIDKYRLPLALTDSLNYFETDFRMRQWFKTLHHCEWEKKHEVHENFHFIKHATDIRTYCPEPVDIIFYDAFSPSVQPELWTKATLSPLVSRIKDNGLLVTYCSKGQFRRDLEGCGFYVRKLKGPPGKREITRAMRRIM